MPIERDVSRAFFFGRQDSIPVRVQQVQNLLMCFFSPVILKYVDPQAGEVSAETLGDLDFVMDPAVVFDIAADEADNDASSRC